jgi:uncharacterized protein (TIRG00374 family)
MRLRGALLGAGNIALRGHAPQWAHDARLREEVEIVAVADLAVSNLEKARAFFPEARLYQRAEDLLDAETLDFCDICTPPFTHRALVERAARLELHVICEKPLAPTVLEAERIARAVRDAGIVFQPCHQHAYSPQWQAVKARLPRIGHVYLAEYEVRRTAADTGNAHWSPAWRTDRDLAGGGILVDHGAHILYQLHAVLGEPRTVQATVRRLQHRSYQVEDTALVILDYGDALAQVNLTWAAHRREIRFRFVGDRGELVGDDRRLKVHADPAEEITFAEGLSKDSSHSEWYATLFHDFAERVRTGDAGSGALDEALHVTRLIAKAYESSERGRALPLVDVEKPVLEEAADALAEVGADTGLVAVGGVAGEAPEARRRRGRALRAAALLPLAGAVAWTFHDVAWGELWRAMSSARMGWIAAAAAVNLAVVLLQSARWLALVRPLTPAATLGRAFKAMVIGFAVSTIVPARAGELARMRWFGRDTGLSQVSILGSIVIDQLVNAVGLLAGLAVLPLFVDVPLWLRPGGWFALALFTAVAMVVFALRPGEKAPVKEPASSDRFPAKGMARFLVNVRQGLTAARNPRALGLSLGASLVAWGFEVPVIALSMRAVGLRAPLAASFLVLLAVNLALAFPFAPPGNMGTLEVGATLALVEFGVGKSQALAFALCYHFLQVIPIGILGLLLAWNARTHRPAWSR